MKRLEDTNFIYDGAVEINSKYYKYKIIDEILATYYKMLMKIYPCKYVSKKYNVSICSIFKNEAQYLREWIEFHRIIGVEHFYMYNNNSSDDYLTVLKQYIDCGLVTLIEWPQNQAQMQAYKDAIKKFAHESEWIGFIDIDEFVVPNTVNHIYDFLKRFKNRPSVLIYWQLFGSSGYIMRDKKSLVTEDFVVCWPKYYRIGKCFYNTNYGIDMKCSENAVMHHSLWGRIGKTNIPPVNPYDEIAFYNRHVVKAGRMPVQINHYFTKSYDEYKEKQSKGDVYFKANPHTIDYFYGHEMKCSNTDYAAYKYLVKLKLVMRGKLEI